MLFFQLGDGSGDEILKLEIHILTKSLHLVKFIQKFKKDPYRHLAAIDRFLSEMVKENEQELGQKSIPYVINHNFLCQFCTVLKKNFQQICRKFNKKWKPGKGMLSTCPFLVGIDSPLINIMGVNIAFAALFHEYCEPLEGNDNQTMQPIVDNMFEDLFSCTVRLEEKLDEFYRCRDRCKEFTELLGTKWLGDSNFLADCNDTTCAICLNKLTRDADFAIFDCCNHIFCSDCAFEWMRKQR